MIMIPTKIPSQKESNITTSLDAFPLQSICQPFFVQSWEQKYFTFIPFKRHKVLKYSLVGPTLFYLIRFDRYQSIVLNVFLIVTHIYHEELAIKCAASCGHGFHEQSCQNTFAKCQFPNCQQHRLLRIGSRYSMQGNQWLQ